MRIMLPDKLSKMVARIENYVQKFVTVVFEIEHLLRLDSWLPAETLERIVTKILDKTYCQKKPCWQTKDNKECNSKRYQQP